MDPIWNPLPYYNNDTTLEKADRERITKFVLTCWITLLNLAKKDVGLSQ